jgi:hypothetical protein
MLCLQGYSGNSTYMVIAVFKLKGKNRKKGGK